MNWQTVSFDWTQARAFLATAEAGSLSAAARALGLTQPTVGRQVAALEAALGVAVFERTGRELVLTDAGLSLLEPARAMGEAASRLSMAAAGHSTALAGPVTITASDTFCAYWLPPVLGRLRESAPGITVNVNASNRIEDLRRRAADIAIRHVEPKDPDLIARRLPDTHASFYASKGYLDTLPAPLTRDTALEAAFITPAPVAEVLPYLQAIGLPLRPEQIPLISENGVAAWEMVRADLGIGLMLPEIARRCTDVVPVLTQLPPIPVPIWLVTHRELRTSRRIRHVFDMLADALSRPT